jgi:hypothetical protein
MSPRLEEAPARTGRSMVVLLVVLVIAVVLVLLARVRPRNELLDPASGSRSGARGLVLVLQSVGASVKTTATVPVTGDGVNRVVVLVDTLSDNQRQALDVWVEDGGIAVVADPNSPYSGPGAVFTEANAVADDIAQGVCSIPALDKVRIVSFGALSRDGLTITRNPGEDDGSADARQFSFAAGQRHCFGSDQAAFVVTRARGSGLFVSLGENWVFTNELLPSSDNAALATALMAPTKGGHVVILHGTASRERSTTGITRGGDKTLLQLVPKQVWIGIAGLVLAFGVFSLAAGWRVGRPVTERPLVPIASSELVLSTAHLMQRAGHCQRAADLIRYQFHRDLCARYGIDPSLPLDYLDSVIFTRVGDPGRLAPRAVIDVLRSGEVSTTASLTSLARTVRQLRNETM